MPDASGRDDVPSRREHLRTTPPRGKLMSLDTTTHPMWATGAVILALVATACLATGAVARTAVLDGKATPPLDTARTRHDTLLRWDEEGLSGPPAPTTGAAGTELAVLFQAPPWANYVTEIHLYVMNDQVENPHDPELPTTRPFLVHVWRVTPYTLPGVSENAGTEAGEDHPEDSWLALTLPEAVDLTILSHFPMKQFFVGIEWLHDANPVIALDDNLPIDLMSFRRNPEDPIDSTGHTAGRPPVSRGWEILEAHDAKIRAVVSDSPTGAEPSSWAAVKALYR